MFQIIALLPLKPGCAAEVEPLLAEIIAASRQDAGNHGYDCKVDQLNPDCRIFFERWESDAALEAHLAAPHFKKFSDAIAPYLNGELAIHKVNC